MGVRLRQGAARVGDPRDLPASEDGLATTTPVALTATFAEDPTKKTRWFGFVRKVGVGDAGTLAKTFAA